MANRFFKHMIAPLRRRSSGALVTAGSLGYDDADGSLRYFDGKNNVERNLARLYGDTVPQCVLYRSTDQSITTGTDTALLFDQEIADTDNMHSTATNTSRITINTPGLYEFRAQIEWQAGALNGTNRIVWFKHTALATGQVTWYGRVWQSAAQNLAQSTTAQIPCASGDYVEVWVNHSQGGNIAVLTGATGNPQVRTPLFSAVWLGGPGPTVNEVGTPVARVRNSTDTVIANNANPILSYDTKVYDSDGMWASGTPTRLTVKTPGVYRFLAQAVLNAAISTDGRIQLALKKNGTTFLAYNSSGRGAAQVEVAVEEKFAAGDYIEVECYNGIGGTATVQASPPFGTVLSASFITSGKTVIPRARIYRNAAFNLNNGWTKVPFDAIEDGLDNDGMFDSANGRLVIKTAGTYSLGANLQMSQNGTGVQRILNIHVNGKLRASTGAPFTGSSNVRLNVTVPALDLAVGDYVEAYAYQDSGGVLSLALTDYNGFGSSGNVCWLAAEKIGMSGPGPNNEPGWAQNGTAVENTNSGVVRIKTALAEPIVTALPSSPVDGQVINYQASAAGGVIWRLRYNAASSSAYKWEYQGGGFLSDTLNQGGTVLSTTGATGANYNDLTGTGGADGPRATVPLAGEYEIEFGYAAAWNTTAGCYAMMSCMLGPSGDARNTLANMDSRRIENQVGASTPISGSTVINATMAAGEEVYCRYAQSGGGTANWRYQRYLRIRPRRVG